jgi:predicted TIM-barrel fold metal-dependent hydrolase
MTQPIHRRAFLGQALGAAAAGTLPSMAQGAPQSAATQGRGPAGAKFDFHVHLGRDRREMFAMTGDKVSAAVKYLIAEMDKQNVAKSMIVAVEPVFPTELYLDAVKLEPQRLFAACSMMPRPIDQAIDKLKAYHDAGAKALKLQPMEYDPGDPAVERLVYEAVKLRMPVLFHHTDLPKTFPEMLTHFASTFTDGNFVVIHFGGIYGFRDVLPLASLPNVFLETSTAFPRIVNSPLKDDLTFLQQDRLNKLIFGTEHPLDYELVTAAINTLAGEKAAPDVMTAIYRGNAEKLLGLV